jgi:hypothetical protein
MEESKEEKCEKTLEMSDITNFEQEVEWLQEEVGHEDFF